MKDKEFMVEKIRSQYTETEHTELDALKTLDAKVKRPANAFGYTYGSIGAVVMGAGMSLVMTDIGAKIGLTATLVPGIAVGVGLGHFSLILGIAVGLVGMVMVAAAYPTYNRMLKKERAKIAPEILRMTDELLK